MALPTCSAVVVHVTRFVTSSGHGRRQELLQQFLATRQQVRQTTMQQAARRRGVLHCHRRRGTSQQ